MERMTPDTTDFNSLSKKQLVELVIAKYNDCFRLEEENKKLKSDLSECECSMHFENDEVGYRKRECKKLNIKVASLEGEIKGLNYTIDKLREELSAYDREYFDEDKKAKNIYKKQYEHSMGEDDELIYEEGLYD